MGLGSSFWHKISALNKTHAHTPCAQSTHASDVSCSEPRESDAGDTTALPYAHKRAHASANFTSAGLGGVVGVKEGQAGGPEEYFLAGRDTPFWAVGLALFASNIGVCLRERVRVRESARARERVGHVKETMHEWKTF